MCQHLFTDRILLLRGSLVKDQGVACGIIKNIWSLSPVNDGKGGEKEEK